MNKYQVTLTGFSNEIADMPVMREYDPVDGILEAFKIVNHKDLFFLDKRVHKRVLTDVLTEPTSTIILEMYDERDKHIGYIYIKHVI